MSKRAQQKQRTRALLLSSARDVFASRGFDAAGVKDIAQAAGVAVGTVYTHFPDKSAVAIAAFEDDIRRTVAVAWDTLPERDARKQLVHLGRSLLSYYSERPALSRVLLRAILFRDGGDPLLQPFLERVAALLVAAQSTGEVRPGADTEAASLAFFASYTLILIGALAGQVGPLEQQVAALSRQVDLIFTGIGGS